MAQHAKAVLQEALSLSERDRAQIAGALLESLEPVAETGVEAAWKQEVANRLAALESGEVETVPWDEVRDRLYARLSARGQS